MLSLTLLVLTSGCTSLRDCSEVDISAADALPGWLSQTGLYADIDGDVVTEAAIGFEPQFPLWTDGAKKRRWLLLPEGAQVDTSDPNAWVFPVGTQLFKEFTRDSIRLELGWMPSDHGMPMERYASDRARKVNDLDWDAWGARFDYVLTKLARVFTPDHLVLGGGASKKLHKFEHRLRVDVPIHVARFKNNAGIIGAALMVRDARPPPSPR